MTSKEIRQQFLDYFAAKEHAIVPSSPVVPLDDPTLLFTNAGMNQFKDVFLGTGSRSYTRAADTQKCIRAGGKHNDLDDVGQDTYHHTFFEMLGNWSFGDYFKKEAIAWAWELMTQVWRIDKERLHATYFEGDESEGLDPDSEAAELWRTVTDINPDHIHPGNKKDNFWEMGDTGPCGPCSELHIDMTPDLSGSDLVNADDPRVIELWNLVFIQYNRASDRKLSALPAKHVDTGLGFERLCAVLTGMERGQLGKVSNYDTDVFTPIFDAIKKRTGAPEYCGTLPVSGSDEATKRRSDEGGSTSQIMVDVSYRVIADHVRCLTFALTDGAVPSNEGRGYVLRRILRRAVRYGRQYFDMHEPFLCDLVEPVVEHMADTFPELRAAHGGKNIERVKELFRDEEASFLKTLDRGIKLFGDAADHARKHSDGRISGEDAFKLHDTFGFPVDLTQLMAEEAGLTVDSDEYERLMEAAREKARAPTKAAVPRIFHDIARLASPCDDSLKYETPSRCTTVIQATSAQTGDDGAMWVQFVTGATCFYSEQGGQVADVGWVRTRQGEGRVTEVQQSGHTVLHTAVITSGHITGGPCELEVDMACRVPTMKNHTSTHLLNWALREVLGEHVQQKGSLVDPEKTRFDFSHNKPLTTEELGRIEDLVNEQINADHTVYWKEVAKEEALKIKTLRAVFGETYPDSVRVISVGVPIGEVDSEDSGTLLGNPENPEWTKYAVEFCGGTHLARSSEAECFVLVSEEGVAKGIRRVVGVTGEKARVAIETSEQLLAEVTALAGKPPVAPEDLSRDREGAAPSRRLQSARSTEDLGAVLTAFLSQVNATEIPIRVRNELRERIADLQKQARSQKKQASSASGEAVKDAVASLLESAEKVDGITIVVGQVPSASADALRGGIDWIRSKTETSAVLLATASDDRVTLVAGMCKATNAKGIKAGDLIKEIAPLVGGKGGGRPDMAQGGGNDASGIPNALERASAWIRERLS